MLKYTDRTNNAEWLKHRAFELEWAGIFSADRLITHVEWNDINYWCAEHLGHSFDTEDGRINWIAGRATVYVRYPTQAICFKLRWC